MQKRAEIKKEKSKLAKKWSKSYFLQAQTLQQANRYCLCAPNRMGNTKNKTFFFSRLLSAEEKTAQFL